MADAPWASVLADYLDDLKLRQLCEAHIHEQRLTIGRAAANCEWKTIGDFRSDSSRAWLLRLNEAKRAPKTLKLYRDALDRFGAWLKKTGTLPRNPMEAVPQVRVPHRQARLVPTDDEVRRLVAGVYGRKQAKDRWLVYLTAASTGLRHGTLRALRWTMLHLDDDRPRMEIPAALMKTRKPMLVHITPELAMALRFQRAAAEGDRVFACVPKPEQFIRDAVRAKVRRTEGDQTMSFHSLRHYFSNRLMRQGFPVEQRKLANGHSTAAMTLETYTAPELVNLGERMRTLPSLLTGAEFCQPPRNLLDNRAVVTDTRGAEESTMMLAPTHHDDRPAGCSVQSHCLPQQLTTSAERPTEGRRAQGVAQLGRAAGLGPAGRVFKSPHPDFGEQTSPVSSEPTRIGRQVQIQQPGSDAAPANLAHLDALTAAFLASHETLRAAVAARIGGGL